MKYVQSAILLTSLAILSGCGHDVWSYRAVPDINISRPGVMNNQGALVLKIEPDRTALESPAMQRWLKDHPAAASKQTVIIASWRHESAFYNFIDGRTLVIFLDGPPKPGEYWLNPDNAVLISYSAYAAPSAVRDSLEGSIQLERIEGRQIDARVAVRDVTELDTSLFLDRPWDPINREGPFTLRGDYTFKITGPNDPVFEKSQVKWIASNESVAVAQRD